MCPHCPTANSIAQATNPCVTARDRECHTSLSHFALLSSVGWDFASNFNPTTQNTMLAKQDSLTMLILGVFSQGLCGYVLRHEWHLWQSSVTYLFFFFTAICVSIDRFLQNTAPNRCLCFDRIGAWHLGTLASGCSCNELGESTTQLSLPIFGEHVHQRLQFCWRYVTNPCEW